MGEKFSISSDSVDGEPKTRKRKRNTSTPSTETGGAENGGTTASSGETGTAETEKKPIEVSILGTTVDSVTKPKKTRAKKTAEPVLITSTQISGFLNALSTVVSSRKGFEIWKLSDTEITSVAEPLANIIQKSEQLSKLAEHADALALTIAVATIAIPRVIYTVNEGKKKEVLKNVEKREVSESTIGDSGGNASNSTSYDKALSSYNII